MSKFVEFLETLQETKTEHQSHLIKKTIAKNPSYLTLLVIAFNPEISFLSQIDRNVLASPSMTEQNRYATRIEYYAEKIAKYYLQNSDGIPFLTNDRYVENWRNILASFYDLYEGLDTDSKILLKNMVERQVPHCFPNISYDILVELYPDRFPVIEKYVEEIQEETESNFNDDDKSKPKRGRPKKTSTVD